MNNNDRLQLEKIIRENNVEDFTESIREKKHSNLIRTDVNKILLLKTKYNRLLLSNYKQFENILISQCKFLYTNYKDIFNKIVKNEMNIGTLNKLLDKLELIESGDKDQHEASYEVGKLLKQIYIDSVILKEQNEKVKNLKKRKKKAKLPEDKKVKEISWQEFKNQNNISL